MAYRAPGAASLRPADAVLNLPAGKHSHGLSRLAAIESARGSFGQAGEAIGRVTGTRLGKRQNWQKAPLFGLRYNVSVCRCAWPSSMTRSPESRHGG